jgi:putative Holliday junction resolvase
MSGRGARLGVDVGSVRVGVAVCDPDGILATPLVTLPRDQGGPPDDTDGDRVPSDMAAIATIVRERDIVGVIVGLPVTLAGKEGLAAASTRQYADALAKLIDPVPVLLTDERMSTAAAARRLSERGVRGRRQRAVVDQAAAVEILQGWLDARRRQT